MQKNKKKKAPGQLRKTSAALTPEDDKEIAELIGAVNKTSDKTAPGDKEKIGPKFIRHTSRSGREYFSDATTREAVWASALPKNAIIMEQKPEALPAAGQSVESQPVMTSIFKRHVSASGKEYFSDLNTRETVWELPQDAIVL